MKNDSKIRLGTTLYSFTNEFHARQYSFEQLIRKVAELDLGPGLEVVGFQSIDTFPHVEAAYVKWFRDLLDECELEASCLGLNADVKVRKGRPMGVDEIVETQRQQLETANKLGFKVARVQGYICGPEVYEKLEPVARKLDVKMGIEIHAPHTVDDANISAYRESFDRVDSPYLGFIPDFSTSAFAVPGSYVAYMRDGGVPEAAIEASLARWRQGPMEGGGRAAFIEALKAQGLAADHASMLGRMFGMFGRQSPDDWLEIMPRVVHVHGKFYEIGLDGEETAIPYRELLPLFRDAGYAGYISSEWEGHVFSDNGALQNLVDQQKLSVQIPNQAA